MTTTSETRLIAWDTCVVIDAIMGNGKWWAHVEPMYQDALVGKVKLLISEVTVAEVCKGECDHNIEKRMEQVRLFFSNPFIVRRPVDDRVSEMAAYIIRTHRTSTCDALIAATACVFRASALYTRDGLKQNGNKTKLLKLDGLLGPPNYPALSIKPPDFGEYTGSLLLATQVPQ